MATTRLAALLFIAAVGATSALDGSAAGAAPGVEGVAGSASAPLPDAVRKVVDRAELCEHFAGEFNGDRSRRDREINAILTRNRCDRIPSEIQALKARHKGNAAILRSLQRFE